MSRILIIDDDPMVCTAIEIYLARHGFHVTVADGGESGLQALEERELRSDGRPHLHAAYARVRVDQGVSRESAIDPAESDVRLRVRKCRRAGS